MPGFDTDQVGGGGTLFATNVDFSGNSLYAGTPQMVSNGQLLIGSTISPRIRVNTLTAGSGVSIVNGNGTITIGLIGGGIAVEHLTGNTGGQLNPDGSNNFNITGTGSLTVTGSGSTLVPQLTGLTNHAIQIGAGTATLTQLGAGTTGQVLQTNTTADPTWSTATYPSTTTINQLLYSSSSNVVGGLSTANNGVLITSNAGAPSILAETATAGIPLVSGGTGVPPAFTTSVVAGGGTGNTTFTPYSVITAGTSATGAFQNVSGVGTAGQILASNGASALPSWQTVPSGVFAPNAVINIFDDFIGVQGASGYLISNIPWSTPSTGAFTITTSTSTNPGQIRNGQITSASTYLYPAGGGFIIGGGAITLNYVIKVATLSNSTNRYNLYVGLNDTLTGAPANGVWFQYSDNLNSGDWVGNTSSASSTTAANSTVAVINSAFVNLGITINAAGTSASFFVNGTQIANSPIATNLPSTSCSPAISIVWSAGTIALGTILVDLIYFTQTLTTPR